MSGSSTSEDTQALPLPVLYARCVELATTGAKGSTSLQDAVETFTSCSRLIESHSLFSRNEDLDDVPTSHLRYLLVPYLYAQVLASSSSTDLELRHGALQRAIASYSEFLRTCESYGLLGELGRSNYLQQEESSQQDPNTRRAAKIHRFKRDKALDILLQRFENMQPSTSGRDDQDEQEPGPVGGPRGLDEEDEREMWCLKLEKAVLHALGQRETLNQEVELLHHAGQRSHQSRGASTSRPPSYDDPKMKQERKVMMSKLGSIADALMKGGNAKQQMQQNVLKPYHTLPTMTIEQAAEIEWKQAMEAEQRNRAAEVKKQQKKDDDSEDEEEVMKQRAWDDWKDDHPRGMGNSKLRPTA